MKRLVRATIASCLPLIASALSAAEAGPAAKADAALGKQIATKVCVTCHDADGNSTIPGNPKLAGQGAVYTYKQLTDFKGSVGRRPERLSPIMNSMAIGLNDADMKNLAAYYAAQPRTFDVARNPETVELARKLYRGGDTGKGIPACAACHGPAGHGIPKQYPRLSGQFANYTDTQMKSFRSGERGNDRNEMMRTIASRMSDLEIAALADYIAGLR